MNETPVYDQAYSDAIDQAIEIDDMEAMDALEAMDARTEPKVPIDWSFPPIA